MLRERTGTSGSAPARRSASDVFDPCEVGITVPPTRPAVLPTFPRIRGHKGERDVRRDPSGHVVTPETSPKKPDKKVAHVENLWGGRTRQ